MSPKSYRSFFLLVCPFVVIFAGCKSQIASPQQIPLKLDDVAQFTSIEIERERVSIPYVITREGDHRPTIEDLVFVELDRSMKAVRIRNFASGERTFDLEAFSIEKKDDVITISAPMSDVGETVTLTLSPQSLTYLRTDLKNASMSVKTARKISRSEASALLGGG